jgi:hypothetical protein
VSFVTSCTVEGTGPIKIPDQHVLLHCGMYALGRLSLLFTQTYCWGFMG